MDGDGDKDAQQCKRMRNDSHSHEHGDGNDNNDSTTNTAEWIRNLLQSAKYHPTLLPMAAVRCSPSILDRREVARYLHRGLPNAMTSCRPAVCILKDRDGIRQTYGSGSVEGPRRHGRLIRDILRQVRCVALHCLAFVSLRTNILFFYKLYLYGNTVSCPIILANPFSFYIVHISRAKSGRVSFSPRGQEISPRSLLHR